MESVQILDKVVCASLYANANGKGIHLFAQSTGAVEYTDCT